MVKQAQQIAVCTMLLLATQACAQVRTAHSSSPALPESDQMLMMKATQALRASHLDEAIADFERVTKDVPRFAEGHLNLGLTLAQAGRNREASVALSQALALKAGLRGAHLFLAISQYRLGELDSAAASIRKETALDPADAQAWMWQGIVDLGLNHLTSAVAALDKAASLDPKNIDILYHRGRAALALSRASYEEMFKIEPNSWHVHQVLAQADVESDNDVDAIEQYKLAIATAPVQGGLYEALGSSLWRTGKFQEAEQAFETALRLDPEDTLTMYKLGCLRVDRGDAARGKPLLDKVIVADPSLKLASYYLGRAESELGENSAAVTSFKKVIAENVDPDTTKQAWFQLSRVYRKLHDDQASAAAQTEYRRLDQQNRDAMQANLSLRKLRADRDVSIPAPTSSPEADSH